MTLKNTDNADITIINEQTLGDDFDTIETRVSGKFYQKDDKFYLLYSDKESSTTIKIEGQTVSVRRRGAYESHMVYDKQREHEFVYSTPYGKMAMTVVTRDLEINLGENGGYINLRYELLMGGEPCRNNMKITVGLREKGTKK